MGYSFIQQLPFYFLLMKTRHRGEKRIRDADNLPMCRSSVSNIQRLWKSILISAICRGKLSESRTILIFHLCNLWGKPCLFFSLVLLFGPTDFTCWCGASLHSFADALVKCLCLAVLCILHHLLSKSCATPHVFLTCKVQCMPIFRAFHESWEQAALPAHLRVKSHVQLNSARVSYSWITWYCILDRSGHREWYRRQQLSDSSMMAGMSKSVLHQKNLLTAGDNIGLSILHGKSHLWMLKYARAAADVCDLEIWITLILANSFYVQGLSTLSDKNMVYKTWNIEKIV